VTLIAAYLGGGATLSLFSADRPWAEREGFVYAEST
jgi:hypothetical protein